MRYLIQNGIQESELCELNIKEFYELYDLMENLDIVLKGKGWDKIDWKDATTQKLEEEKANELITPDDEQCSICFDKKINIILKCYVIFININKFFFYFN